MVRKILIALLLTATLLGASGLVSAQTPTPPPGLFTALGDLSAQTNRTFTLTCADPNDGSTCAMNDTTLSWSWSQQLFSDDAYGCPNAQASAVGQRLGNAYTFGFGGVQYEYREDLGSGIVFRCTDTGIEAVEPALVDALPPAAPTAAPDAPPNSVQPSPDVNVPQAAAGECPLPARLGVGSSGRVIASGFPSNVRNSPTIDGAQLGEMQPGASFLVLEGPVCATTLLWYRVDYNGLIGWAAEGGGQDYWLEPVSATATGQTIVPASASNVAGLQQIVANNLSSSGDISVYAAVSDQLIVAAGSQLDFYPMSSSTGQPAVSNPLVGGEVVALSINNAGTRLVSLQNSAEGSVVRFWEVGSGPTLSDLGELPISTGQAFWLKIDPTGRYLAIGIQSDPTYRVEVYDLTLSPLIPAPLAQSAPPVSMDFLSSGGTLAVMGSDAFITFYTTRDYQIARSLLGYGYVSDQSTGVASAISLTPNGQELALLSSNPITDEKVIEAWDLLLTRVLWTAPLPNGARDLDTSPDASLVMVAYDGGMILHDLANGAALRQIEGVEVTRAFFDPNGRLHMIGGGEGAFTWAVWGVPGQ